MKNVKLSFQYVVYYKMLVQLVKTVNKRFYVILFEFYKKKYRNIENKLKIDKGYLL